MGEFDQEILFEIQKTQYADAAIFISPYAVWTNVSSGQDAKIQFFGCSDWFLEELVLNPPREALQNLFRSEANYLYQVVSGKTQCLKIITTNFNILKKEYSNKSSIMVFNFKKGHK